MTTLTSHGPSFPVAVNVVLLVVRVFLGVMILTHGYAKVFRGGRLAGTAAWFDKIGMRPGAINAFMAAATELGVGTLLVLGLLTPLAAAGLISVMTVAIVTVHRQNGFLIYNEGGGIEHCLAIAIMSIVPGALGAGKYSLDHVWNVFKWTSMTSLVVTVVVGLGGAALQLAACYRPPKRG